MFAFFVFGYYKNGEYMKKITAVFIFFILFFVKGGVYYDSDVYGFHTLEFSNLSTRNFFDYFSDIKVIRVYPFVNPIYSDRVHYYYDVHSGNLNEEINNFKEEYLKVIKKNSYLDYNYLYVNGINIYKLDIYVSNRDLNRLINSELLVNVIK